MTTGEVPPTVPAGFHIPWSQVDPTLKHGGIPAVVGTGYVGPKLGDNTASKNTDSRVVFAALRDFTASVSMHPQANVEGPPLKPMVEEVLRGLNWLMERLWDRTKSSATTMFLWTHATPPSELFRLRPVRFPLRSEFAHAAVETLLGTMIETAEMNVNAIHSGFDPASTAKMLAPLLWIKSNIMRDHFDVEVSGEITADELATMFATTSPPPGPTITPPGESAPTPTAASVTAAKTGADVVQWYPSPQEWAVFGRKRDALYRAERIFQPEGATGTTEDIGPETTIPAAGGSSAAVTGAD